jgi:excisionase family DNA binding protein
MSKKVINDVAPKQATDGSSDSLLTKKELAPHLRVGPRTVDEWMRKKRVPFLKIGKTVRFRLSDVLEKLNTFRVN